MHIRKQIDRETINNIAAPYLLVEMINWEHVHAFTFPEVWELSSSSHHKQIVNTNVMLLMVSLYIQYITLDGSLYT